MEEVWMPVNGYDGLYKISNLGNIKRLRRLVVRFGKGKMFLEEKILKPQKRYNSGNGVYLKIDLTDNYGKTMQLSMHRLVAEAFLPNPENKPTVNHKNGNPSDNRLSNLEWCTHKENSQHAITVLDRFIRGEDHFNSILSDKQVLEVRRKYIPRIYSQRVLAKEYGVSQYCILSIVNNRYRKVAE